MKKLIVFLITTFSLGAAAAPIPFPVFLKAGFSSVLEFDDIPVRVVLGDAQSFQVEKMDHSLVIRTLVPFASTNMFAYFKTDEPRLFLLTASEDAIPTYYKKFESVTPKPIPQVPQVRHTIVVGAKLVGAHFDAKKDFLTVEVELIADSRAILRPHWEWVRLGFGDKVITPSHLWSERREVQKDSKVRARFIFTKPNVPRDLGGTRLVVPLEDNPNALTIKLRGEK